MYTTYADDGTPTTQLTFGSGLEDHPAATQTEMAYCSQRGDAVDIFVVEGMSTIWATDDEYPDYWPDFNPHAAGDYDIAFTKGVWNVVEEIVEYYIYGWPGHMPCEPITLSEGGDFQPTWSPDGSEIAFVRNASIHKVEVDTHNVNQLTSGHSDSYPDWGIDGRIMWIRTQSEIRVMDGDGANQQVLVDPPEFVMSAAWSPTQDRIAMILLLQGSMDIFIYELS